MKVKKERFIYKDFPYYFELTRRQFKELRSRLESGEYPVTIVGYARNNDSKVQIDQSRFIVQQSQAPNFDVGEIVKVRLRYMMTLDNRGMCLFVNSGIAQGLPVPLWQKIAYMLKPKTAKK